VPNPCLCHDGNGNCVHDLLYHLWVAHASYTTLGSYVRGNALQGHDGGCASFFCYACLEKSQSRLCRCLSIFSVS
jgi:hypothetical protein